MVPDKILLFDADATLALNITTALTDSGYKVIRRFDGIGALDVIYSELPSLIILDINLPGMNSLAIIRSIRSEGYHSRIPIILIGSDLREEDILIGLEVGADLCVREMFHPRGFIARVRSLLRRIETVKAY